MATKQRRPNPDRLTHPLLEKLGAIPAAQVEIFAYSVKIVCGKQTEAHCCCVAGARPGVYATEVNIQNLNLVRAPVVKLNRAAKLLCEVHHNVPDRSLLPFTSG
jgi:hypothetical protein